MRSSKTLRPPRHLRGEACRAWSALEPKLLAAGLYVPSLDRCALEALCSARALAQLASDRLKSAPAAHRAVLLEIRDAMRLDAREWAAQFLVLPKARIHLAVLDANGDDVELRALFTPGAALRVVPLTPAERGNLQAWNDRTRTIDPRDPPRVESQAAYLDRLGLLSAAARLEPTAAAFMPEVISSRRDAPHPECAEPPALTPGSSLPPAKKPARRWLLT